MNKQQLKDSELCEEMSVQGEDMECFRCSCNVCIANMSNEVETYKNQLLKKLELFKDDIPHQFCSVDEVYGATKMFNNIFKLIKKES